MVMKIFIWVNENVPLFSADKKKHRNKPYICRYLLFAGFLEWLEMKN